MRLQVVHIAAFVSLAACSGGDQSSVVRAASAANAPPPRDSVASVWLTADRRAEEDSLFLRSAEAAWRFIDRNYVAATGLVRPFDTYAIGTMWDVASGLGAMYCAHELGLLADEGYDARMTRALATLERLQLFDDVGFNKEYAVGDGRIIGIKRVPSTRGYGASATDHGRLLVWLRIIADRDPAHAAAARRVVRRLDLDAFVDDGYLVGRQVSRRTGRTRSFQEGRIGYEQYAATGFRLWGARASNALDITRNARDAEVSGIVVPADRRGSDRLTSEPFVLLGMEVGWSPVEDAIAQRLLAAQEARYDSTNTITIVSEDAIDRAPDYFYYYTILSPRGPWSIEVQRQARVSGPRWVSTKAAFAWHALLPDSYTRMAVDTVRAHALVGGVWGSGVFENGRATATPNINTAAVVLEAALYRRAGAPLLQRSRNDSTVVAVR